MAPDESLSSARRMSPRHEFVFLSYRQDLLHGDVFQEENLTFLKVLDARIGIVKNEDIAIGADTLQNGAGSYLVDVYGVAGQSDVGNRSRKFPKIMDTPGGRDTRCGGRRTLLRTGDQQRE